MTFNPYARIKPENSGDFARPVLYELTSLNNILGLSDETNTFMEPISN